MMDTHEGIEFLDVCLNSTTSMDCQRKGANPAKTPNSMSFEAYLQNKSN